MGEEREHRFDVLAGRWVIVAENRGPISQGKDPGSPLPTPAGSCPFCPGSEGATEEEVDREPAEGPWSVRVVTNKYPAVSFEVPPAAQEASVAPSLPAWGAHEVVVETPEHDVDLVDYSSEQCGRLLRVIRRRMSALERIEGIAQVNVFRNRGRWSGSSQPHPHLQILASRVLGPEQERRWNRARAHHAAHGRALLDEVLERELDAKIRVVEETERFVVLSPFAPQRRFETWLVPRVERGAFGQSDDAQLEALATLLPSTVRRVLAASDRSAYNLVLRSPPAEGVGDPAGFWYVEIAPRGGGPAGFELSSGMALVATSPEEAARRIRATP